MKPLVTVAAGSILAILLSLPVLRAQPSLSSTPVASYWMRMYPMSSYAEIWRLRLEVPDLKKAVPRAVSTLEKRGGESVLPVDLMASSKLALFQQLSFRFPSSNAAKAVSELQKLGDVQELQKNAGTNPGVAAEVREKLGLLKAEQEANQAALEKMPTVRTAILEMIAHLEAVDRSEREASRRVLLNIELRERAAAAPKH